MPKVNLNLLRPRGGFLWWTIAGKVGMGVGPYHGFVWLEDRGQCCDCLMSMWSIARHEVISFYDNLAVHNFFKEN